MPLPSETSVGTTFSSAAAAGAAWARANRSSAMIGIDAFSMTPPLRAGCAIRSIVASKTGEEFLSPILGGASGGLGRSSGRKIESENQRHPADKSAAGRLLEAGHRRPHRPRGEIDHVD